MENLGMSTVQMSLANRGEKIMTLNDYNKMVKFGVVISVDFSSRSIQLDFDQRLDYVDCETNIAP
jgi:hypothetical protein